jgi:hypothetical protein
MSVTLNKNNNSLIYGNQFYNNLECFFDEQPDDIINRIFHGLDDTDLKVCHLVCKRWNRLVSDPLFLEMFLENHYSELLAAFGKLSQLPHRIRQIIESPSPIPGHEGKKIKDTHVVFYKPKKINGMEYTIRNIPEIFRAAGKMYTYRNIYLDNFPHECSEIKEFANTPVEKEGWVAVTRDLLPESRNKTFTEQRELIDILNEKNEKAEFKYQVPKLIDVISAVFVEHLRSGKCLYNSGKIPRFDNPPTFTQCQETNDRLQLRFAGGFFHVRPCEEGIQQCPQKCGTKDGITILDLDIRAGHSQSDRRNDIGIGGVLNLQEDETKKP